MRILSWNLLRRNGATGDDLVRLVERHRPDLLLMQEARSLVERLPHRLGGTVRREPMPGRDDGPAAWSPHPMQAEPVPLPAGTRFDLPMPMPMPGRPRRRVALLVRWNGLRIGNVHLDHGQRANRRQLRHLVAVARPDLLVGDFNALGPTRLPGYADIGPRRATHRAYGVLPLRLDRCLSRRLQATRVEALDYGRSDHRPILLDLAAPHA